MARPTPSTTLEKSWAAQIFRTGRFHAFLWKDGVVKDLGTVRERAQAWDINSKSQIVVSRWGKSPPRDRCPPSYVFADMHRCRRLGSWIGSKTVLPLNFSISLLPPRYRCHALKIARPLWEPSGRRCAADNVSITRPLEKMPGFFAICRQFRKP